MRHPKKFRVCGCTEYALTLMTNQHVPSWEDWTTANRDRSQEEWIKDGFLKYSIEVHLPPQSDDAVPLLRLLGRKTWHFLWSGPQGEKAPEAVPSYIQYNAFRWLRDSGFNPHQFAAEHSAQAAEPDILEGLLQFYRWRNAYSGREGLGVLAFGKESDTSLPPAPLATSPWFAAGVFAFITISIAMGFALLFRVRHRRPTSSNNSPTTTSTAR